MTADANKIGSMYITNGRVLAPKGIIEEGHLLIKAGQISSVGSDQIAINDAVQRIDADGAWVVPGLIDLHSHGLLGHDNMGPGLAEAIKAYPSVGVTSFLATTISAPVDQLSESLHQMASVLSDPPPGASCLGFHLEGPFLSKSQAGMANSDWFRPFSLQEINDWQQAADGHIKIITLAPEVLDSPHSIKELKQSGLIVSAGHTAATYEQCMAAVQAGLSHATHTFNAMSGLHHRRPGAVGAILNADGVKAEVIADGEHVHPEVISLLVKVKGTDKCMLVSDSAPMAGLAEGQYSWQEQNIIVTGGRCQLTDGTLAGAYHSLDAGLRTIVNETNLTIEDAVQMAATTPAAALGLTSKGQLSPGMEADVVLLDDNHRPVMTIGAGQVLWSKSDPSA